MPHKQFNAVMETPFCEATFWNPSAKKSVIDWRGGQVARITNDPTEWKTLGGHKPWQAEFWTVDVSIQQTRWVWRFLRDALSHWNVASADRSYRNFDEDGTMQRLLFYRAPDDNGSYTLKRWKVTKVETGGGVLEITLMPDNKGLPSILFKLADDEAHVVAEYLETLG
jgi:hypothetical protein